MYSITSHLVDETLSSYIIFHIMPSEIPLAYSKYGVTIMDKQAAENSFMDSFYSNTELAREILTNTEDAAPSPSPPVSYTHLDVYKRQRPFHGPQTHG